MQIFVPFLIVGSVLYRFHKGFRKFVLGGVVLMDCFPCLKHSALDYDDLWNTLFLFGRFKAVYRILGLFLLFGLGLGFLFSNHFYSGIVRFLRALSGKSVNLRTGFCFCSKNGKFRLSKLWKSASYVPYINKLEMEKVQNLNSTISDDSGDEKEQNLNSSISDDSGDEKECKDEEIETDITKFRELLKSEKQKVEDICAELAMERAASATAAEEAMAMILRLQHEKSSVEMEWSQYRRLAEEKQIHDQQVIRSLQWLVWQHEFKANLSMEEDKQTPPCSRRRRRSKSKEDGEESDDEARSPFNGNILDALENVLYSSRDSVCFSN